MLINFKLQNKVFFSEFIALTSCNGGCLQRESVNATTVQDMVGNGTW